MKNVDLLLQSLMSKHKTSAQRRVSAGEPEADAPAPTFAVLVRFTGDVEELRAAGLVTGLILKHPREPFSIATGTIPMERIAELAAIPHVEQIEGPRTFRSELNKSVPEIGAKILHEQIPTPYKGQGVVIGIIDTGFDFRHEAFRKQDGTTRVLAIWDQLLEKQDKEKTPRDHPYGVEYTKDQIDAELVAAKPHTIVRTQAPERPDNDDDDDDKGHGTHVGGIAAGDGSKAGSCHGAFTYVGVAPEADLIVVKLSNSLDFGARLLEAVDYIFKHPMAAGKPVVINLSIGNNLGSHDGRSLVELGIEALVLQEHGRAVVKSAGNGAGSTSSQANRHATAKVPKNGVDPVVLTLTVFAEDKADCSIDIWYTAGELPNPAELVVEVEAPVSGASDRPKIAPGNDDPAWVANPSAGAHCQTIVHILSSYEPCPPAGHYDGHILIRLVPETREEKGKQVKAQIPAGTWRLHLSNPGADDIRFDAWIDRENGPKFPPATDTTALIRASDDKTISIPGTSRYVITVGAYDTRAAADDPPERSSSRGPTRAGEIKPDIMAPGVGIVSAASNEWKSWWTWCCDCCIDYYCPNDGTSVAAPHVTGVVALMLQKNPGLGIEEILELLKKTARRPGGNITIPNNDWGWGKVDALAAVNAVPAPTPSPTPTPLRPAPSPAGGGGTPGSGARDAEIPPPLDSPVPPRVPLRGRRTPATWLLRDRVTKTPEGQLYAAVISRHFSEVRGLINSHREVATSWHLARGPRLLRHLLELMRFPARPRPAVLSSPAGRAHLHRFLDLLAQHGSPELRQHIEQHGRSLLAQVEHPERLLELPDTRSSHAQP